MAMDGGIDSAQNVTAGDSEWIALLDEVADRSTWKTDRKQDRSRRTERQILNAALRIFARDGISRSRIADIAAEAGISTSTLYEYYKSKEDMAYDIPIAHLSEFFQLFRQAENSGMSAKEKLVLYLTMSADYAREHAEWARLLYLEIWPSVFVSETEMRHSIDDFTRVLRFLVEQGKNEGWISKKRNTYETVALIVGGTNQIIITWLLYRKPRNLTKSGAEIVERIVNLLEMEAKLEN
jgi:AcrR family transcriptional regulator